MSCPPESTLHSSSSEETKKSLPRLAQHQPALVCPNARLFVAMTDEAKRLKRCRSRRCSIECASAWASKLNLCLGVHLKSIVTPGLLTSYTISQLTTEPIPELAAFRGHLTLPKGATPDDHRQAKSRFLRALNGARKKSGAVIELHAVLDLTSPTEGHYDYLLYTNLPEPQVRRLIRRAWGEGYRYALIPVNDCFLQAACRYHAKATRSPSGEEPLLPVKRGEPGYLEATWHTARWWRGSSMEKTWLAYWEAVYPPVEVDDYWHDHPGTPENYPAREPVGHRLVRILDTNPETTGSTFPECEPRDLDKVPPFLRILFAGELPPSHREARLSRLARIITPLVPSDPAQAVHPDVLADRLGIHPCLMPGVLANAPCLIQNGNRIYRL